MSQIGNLVVRIGADTSDLQKGMQDARGQLASLRASAMPAIKAIAAVGAAATAAAGALAYFTKQGLDAVDEQAKLARGLGGTVTGLQALERAAGRAGVASGELQAATQRLNQRLGQAVIEGGAAADALEMIGLRASDLIGMDVDERMATLSDSMKTMGLNSQETSFILRELGIRQSRIVNLMQDGGDAIRDSRTAIEELGAAVSDVDASMVEAANDAMSEFGIIIQGIQSRLAIEFAPILQEISERITNMVRDAGGFGDVISSGMRMAVTSIGSVLDAFHNVRLAVLQIEEGLARIDLAGARFASNLWRAAGPVFDAIINRINQVIEGFNSLTGATIDTLGSFDDGAFMSGVAQNLESAGNKVFDLAWALKDLEDAGLPSDRINEFFDNVERRRREMEEQFAGRDNTGMFGLGGEDDDEGGAGGSAQQGRNDREMEMLRSHLAARVEALRESLMDEEELELHRFEGRLEQIREARDMEVLTEQEYNELKEQLAEQHEEKMNGIAQRAADDRARIEKRHSDVIMNMRRDVLNQSVALLDLFAGESKLAAIASIALQKGLAIAQTVMNTQVAQMRAMAELGPIAGPPAAARIGAMGAVSAGIIAAQGLAQAASAMGGGGASSVSSSVGGSANQPNAPGASGAAAATPVGGTLTVQGISSSALFTGDAVRELAEELINYQKRGGTITIA